MGNQGTNHLAETLYADIKADIFDFHLLPGDRFTETEIAQRYGVSRTPVRDALYRLKREGYLEVAFRSGWSVCQLDFAQFDQLYDFRLLIEVAAVERVCRGGPYIELEALRDSWAEAASQQERDPKRLAEMDERFHCTLVDLCGNREMAAAHAQITDRIRIIRRLDFAKSPRVDAFYAEHPAILDELLQRRAGEAAALLRAHILKSLEESRKITVHMLFEARAAAGGLAWERTSSHEQSDAPSTVENVSPRKRSIGHGGENGKAKPDQPLLPTRSPGAGRSFSTSRRNR